MAEEKIFYATGRRKTSTARVFLKAGNGKFVVNQKPIEDYLKLKYSLRVVQEPFEMTKTLSSFDIYCTVRGGGETGQVGAIRLGVARALCATDENLRPVLKKAGFLMRDSRMVERKKYGLRGARKATQYSKR